MFPFRIVKQAAPKLSATGETGHCLVMLSPMHDCAVQPRDQSRSGRKRSDFLYDAKRRTCGLRNPRAGGRRAIAAIPHSATQQKADAGHSDRTREPANHLGCKSPSRHPPTAFMFTNLLLIAPWCLGGAFFTNLQPPSYRRSTIFFIVVYEETLAAAFTCATVWANGHD